MPSKRKIPDSWRTGWKAKACTSFVLYLKVFKNHLYHLWHVTVFSIKPCLHTQLPEHNKSYRKVSQGWGHLITWNGPMLGHLNSFSASGGGKLNKNFPKIQMSGGLPGGGMLKLRFDWYITLACVRSFTSTSLSRDMKIYFTMYLKCSSEKKRLNTNVKRENDICLVTHFR